MSNKKVDIERALRDQEYYQSLSDADKALVPDHPAGAIELTDEDLDSASGGIAIDDPGTTECSQNPTDCETKYTAIYCCG